MNWNRISAIGGLTFCTTMLGFGVVSGVTPSITMGAVVSAILTSGVAIFTEMKAESELSNIINSGLIV